jgi:hypothetical protein
MTYNTVQKLTFHEIRTLLSDRELDRPKLFYEFGDTVNNFMTNQETSTGRLQTVVRSKPVSSHIFRCLM